MIFFLHKINMRFFSETKKHVPLQTETLKVYAQRTMKTLENYFIRFKALPPFFSDKPAADTNIIVIIPCYDDEFVFRTLESLENARHYYLKEQSSSCEVIVNVNSGETTPREIIERNIFIFNELQHKAQAGFYKNFRLLPILVEGTVKKKAGVGYARKTAMDEALRRFAMIEKPDGLIVSLDADTLVSPDYFKVITKAMQHADAKCFTFQFRHNFDAAMYSKEVIEACKLYEIYLRYYRLALKTFNSPFAIHTIGSCFAIRAEAYAQVGGMPPRQGGEDFYFLQKAAKMHPVYEVREQIVFPSPRISDRVPFGTGPSVGHIIADGSYRVYNFGLFGVLRRFYDCFLQDCFVPRNDVPINDVPEEVLDFIGEENFEAAVKESIRYSSSHKAFVKRMLNIYDAFFIVKFLNSFKQKSDFPPIDVMEVAKQILDYFYVDYQGKDIYEEIVKLDLATI